MQKASQDQPVTLPGNHGQFGRDVATEAYRPLRATQRVTVKPVVPRQAGRAIIAGSGGSAERKSF